MESKRDETRMTVWNKVMLPKTFSSPPDERHSFDAAAHPFCCVPPFSGTLIWRWWLIPCPTCRRVPLNKALTMSLRLIRAYMWSRKPFFIFVLSGCRIKVFFTKMPPCLHLLLSLGVFILLLVWPAYMKRRLLAWNLSTIGLYTSSEAASGPIWLTGSTESQTFPSMCGLALKITTCFPNYAMSQWHVNIWGQRSPLIIVNGFIRLRNDCGGCTEALAPSCIQI